jgi:hypothetical protein
MAKILYVDSDGVKGTLPEGTLGYDAYTAGGDEGRLYVGTAEGNVAQATKSEVDTKVDKTSVVTAAITSVTFNADGTITIEV